MRESYNPRFSGLWTTMILSSRAAHASAMSPDPSVEASSMRMISKSRSVWLTMDAMHSSSHCATL